MLGALPAYASHVSSAVVDPLVLPGDWDDEVADVVSDLDVFGYSIYARVVLTLLLHYSDDRDTSKRNAWALRHFQALALYAKDVIYVPGATSAVFGKNASKADLEDIVSKVEQLTAYLLNHSIDDGWFVRVVPKLSSGKTSANDQVEALFGGLINPLTGDSVRESRILCSILRHVFSNVSKADADLFIGLAKTVEKKGMSLCTSSNTYSYYDL